MFLVIFGCSTLLNTLVTLLKAYLNIVFDYPYYFQFVTLHTWYSTL